jgi:dTDP-L-rhamnose 4-epimerase
VVALRFFNVYGPRQSLLNPYTGACAIFSARLRSAKSPVLYEDGEQTRDFIHVSDIVQGITIALDHPKAPGHILNVGTGSAVSIRQVADALAKAYGSSIQPTIAGRYRAGDIRHCFADIGRLRSFGFQPRVTLEEGLRDLVEWGKKAEAADLFDAAERELVERQLLGD